jgi:hypothetical protein
LRETLDKFGIFKVDDPRNPFVVYAWKPNDPLLEPLKRLKLRITAPDGYQQTQLLITELHTAPS